MYIIKAERYWGVVDNENVLVCLTVYRKGAIEVVRRLAGEEAARDVEIYPDGDYLLQRGTPLRVHLRPRKSEAAYARR